MLTTMKKLYLFILLLIFIHILRAGTYPEVFTTSPLNNDQNIPINIVLKLYFNHHMQESTINNTSISLTDEYGNDIKGVVIYDDTRKCALFKPEKYLDWDTNYTLLISGYLIKNKLGYPLKRDYVINFKTMKEIKLSKDNDLKKDILPKIISTYPLPNSKDIPLNTEIKIRFNKDILPSSLNKFTVICYRKRDKKIIPGIYRYISSKRVFFFKPERLEENTTYIVEIKEGIRDINDIALSNPSKFEFKTLDLTAPKIIKTSPINKAKNISPHSRIIIIFSEPIDMDTITPKNVFLLLNRKKINVSIEYDNKFNFLELKHKYPLLPGKYKLHIKNLSDLSGNKMPDYILEFSIEKAKKSANLIKCYPENGQKNIPVNKVIQLKYSKDLKKITVNGLNIFIREKKTKVKPKFRILNKKNTIEIIPLKPLKYETTYEVVITPRIKDIDDLNIKPMIITFSTIKKPDTTPPYLLTKTLKNKNVPLKFKAIFKFSEPLKPEKINKNTIIIKDKDNNAINGNVIFKPPYTLVFETIKPLKFENDYTLIIFGNDISDFSNNHIKKDLIFSFKTLEKPDKTPPKIVATYPKNNSQNISLNVEFRVIFNEPLKKESINIYSVLLYKDTEAILGDVKLENENTIIFKPRSKLSYDSTYNLILTDRICDLFENYLQKPFNLTFKTKKKPDKIPPKILYTSPIPGSINVKQNALITIKFSEPLNKNTLNTKNIKLLSNSELIPFKINYDMRMNKLIIMPEKTLEYNTFYDLILTNNIKDLAGNKLQSEKHITFKTEPEPDKIPPILLTNFPENNSTNVPLNTHISFTFNEPLLEESVNEFTFILENMQTNKKVACIVYYNQKENLVEIIPSNKLEYKCQYRAIVSPDICDKNGNKINKKIIINFKTKLPPDKKRPEIVKTEPENYANNVSLNPTLKIYFNEAIKEITLNKFTVTMKDENDNKIPITIKYDKNRFVLYVTPKNKLDYFTSYNLLISRMIGDLAGNCMSATYVLEFKTKNKPDTTPPYLISIIPENNAKNVKRNTSIVAIFSEMLDDSSVNKANIILKNNKKEIEFELSYESKLSRITITPLKPLDFNTKYTVYFMNGIRDIAGNRLKENILCNFKTIKRPDTIRPIVIKSIPEDADINISINPVIRVFFSEAINEDTINSTNITLGDGNILIPGKINYKKDKYYIKFTPLNKLDYAKEYHFMVSNAITDLSGNHLKKSYVISFTTKNPPDTIPPALINYFPKHNSINNKENLEIKLYFSEQIDRDSINNYTVFLKGENQIIPCQIKYSPLQRAIILKPYKSLKRGILYIVHITEGITDKAGNALSNPKNIKFSIGKPVDNKPPVLMLQNPENNMINVDPNTIIFATFSKPLDPNTVNKYTVLLKQNNKIIKGNIIYNDALLRIEFYPKKPLSYGKKYTVILTPGIRGKNGINISNEIKWSFRVVKYER